MGTRPVVSIGLFLQRRVQVQARRTVMPQAGTIGAQTNLWQNADMASGLNVGQRTQHNDAGAGTAP